MFPRVKRVPRQPDKRNPWTRSGGFTPAPTRLRKAPTMRTPRPMLIVLSLTVGTILNVAVAWSAALILGDSFQVVQRPTALPSAWPTPPQGKRISLAPTIKTDASPALAPRVNNADHAGRAVAGETGGRTWRVTELYVNPGDSSRFEQQIRQFGWPFRSLYSRREFSCVGAIGGVGLRYIDHPPPNLRHGVALADLLSRGDRNSAFYYAAWPDWCTTKLPLAPRWPAFLTNTSLYTLLAFTLLPFLNPRGHRLSRNLCPNCRYPTSGLATCPECGTQWQRLPAADSGVPCAAEDNPRPKIP